METTVKHFDLKTIKPCWFLLAGIVIMTLSHLSWNIDILAWISMVPFLIYLNLTKGWRSRLIFAAALVISWSLIVLKIITHPVPYFLIPVYSIPISLIHLPGYMVYGKIKNSKWSVMLFPAIMVVMEWIQYTFTPLASWGVAAYTQADSIYVIQGVSIFGMAGLSFVIYWFNSAVTDLLISKKAGTLNFAIPLTILTALLIFGRLRLDHSKIKGRDTMQVAAVGTDSEIGGLPLPSEESNREVIYAIFKRTETAAKGGAQLAVWNEAAFFLTPGNEKSWLDSIALLARKNSIAIVASFVVPVSEAPFKFENKYVFFAPDGTILGQYLKHEPVPGEPAVRGRTKLTANRLNESNIGGAICYDYDFPYLAKRNMEAGADIVAVPSSDWRGIDPLHTRMAAFRALEQGHSVIRSTRFGLSAAISPYGELISQMSSFDSNSKILISGLPAKGIKTVYSFTGDILVYLCICLILFASVKAAAGSRKQRM